MKRHLWLAAVAGLCGAATVLASTVTVVGPGGGTILYDGKNVGPVPLRLTQVPPGRHIVHVVTAAGERTFDLTYPPGQNLDRTIDMNVELARQQPGAVVPQPGVPQPNAPLAVPPDQLDYSYEYAPPAYTTQYPYAYDSPYDYSYNPGYYDTSWGYPYYGSYGGYYGGGRHFDHFRRGTTGTSGTAAVTTPAATAAGTPLSASLFQSRASATSASSARAALFRSPGVSSSASLRTATPFASHQSFASSASLSRSSSSHSSGGRSGGGRSGGGHRR